jgi:uncharacterized membrane protein YphA (DoxX/SURF4 family)
LIPKINRKVSAGNYVSFALNAYSDSFCSILVAAGLATRSAALLIFINLFVSWTQVDHFQFFARGGNPGEAIVLYVIGFVTIALAGPGRISVDAVLGEQ